MRYTKSGDQTAVGPESNFTGTVYIDSVRKPDEQSSIGCAHVRFTPDARTVWHHHPNGQTLYVTDGIGLVCRRGEASRRRSAPATSSTSSLARSTGTARPPERFMAHIAMQEADDNGQVVTWLDHVTDAEYGQASK